MIFLNTCTLDMDILDLIFLNTCTLNMDILDFTHDDLHVTKIFLN